MVMLVAGLLLWSVVHFIPAAAVSFRASLIEKMGKGAYSAVFALLIIASIVLIVFGWRSITPSFLYVLPELKTVAMVLVLLGFLLMGAANYATRIKQVVRHPQLTGVAVWAVAHLLLNGDTRSIVLFGGLLVWSVVEILLINKRDGEWVKPEVPTLQKEIVGLLISLLVFVVFVFIHPYIAGVPVH